jgi:hypothetical protein
MILPMVAGAAGPAGERDGDRDGLSDRLENTLLQQFQPQWMISKDDCSEKPAQFEPGVAIPKVVADDGTIYGQASPHRGRRDEVELHFYHLWRQDCGEMGHALDAEHVSVLLHRTSEQAGEPEWRAMYWYAAAHEDTMCDASQITKASTLEAETSGTKVWISPGKHASFLNEELCSSGCGGDHCSFMKPLERSEVVNLGELSHPADGAIWIASTRWPLTDKMRRTDFTETRLRRLERLPDTDVAWANPAKRPAQAAIYGGNSALNGVATGGRSTDTALVLANESTGEALGKAQHNTGDALKKSYRNVIKALGGAASATGQALEGKSDKPEKDPKSPQ